MSKSPDLSAFPIPRKGRARPIAAEEFNNPGHPTSATGKGTEANVISHRATEQPDPGIPVSAETARAFNSSITPTILSHQPATSFNGQVVATTVKLDERRYLRLVNAGQPGPGRLKRRTIQEMMVEAIDEWFERRGI